MLDSYEIERLEEAQQLAMDNPMPRELEDAIGLWIEPYTMNVRLEHDDVMEAIGLAYPLIRDYLRAHPAELKP